MKIFVVNCGSSSIKYQLFDMANESVIAKGIMERVGTDSATLKHSTNSATHEIQVAAPDHTAGMETILATLVDPEKGVIKNIREIDGVGHRTVHGGEEVNSSAIIDADLIDIMKRNSDLAPLHNPPNLAGIDAAMKAIPHVPHVAVFDTAFLSTLPPKAYRYAVPAEWYNVFHVRKYGFHGTSHRYVTLRAAELLNKLPAAVNLITCHLGNGCSMTAVAGGKAVDHSMGMTPLEGLVMGTRSGDIDPAIILYMISRGMSPQQVDRALNKSSGLLGLSNGLSNDMRDLLAAADKGDKNARLAVEIFVYRIVKYIGSYCAVLPSVDAVVLTGGVGENSVPIRRMICQGLRQLGANLDDARNDSVIRGKAGAITSDDSRMPVWVVPTNEELMIARDTRALVAGVAK